MSVFANLPLDVLPTIVDHLTTSHDLLTLSLVSKSFYSVTAPLLYRSISILPWTKGGKTMAIHLFNTLAACPHLARNVRKLEIRDFPERTTHYWNEELYDFGNNTVPRAIANCSNLHTCIWTRHGTLMPWILQAMLMCPITELEINADADRQYEPSKLLLFSNLESLTLVLPTKPVLDVLGPWTYAMQSTLRSLSIFHDSSKGRRHVTDALLISIAPNLTHLQYLRIIGCDRVTHIGIAAIITHNITGLRALDVQHLSPLFDLAALVQLTHMHSRALARLEHVKLAPQSQDDFLALSSQWRAGLFGLLNLTSSIKTLHISASNSEIVSQTNADLFYKEISAKYGSSLIHLAAHRIILAPWTLAKICKDCIVLEDLFFGFDWVHRACLSSYLSCARRLRNLHITIRRHGLGPPELRTLMLFDAEEIVRACSWTLVQIGSNWLVWEVKRECRRDADGNVDVETRLSPCKRAEVPEQFLAVLGFSVAQ